MIGQFTPELRATATVNPFRYVNVSGVNKGAQAGAGATAVGVSQGDSRAFDDAAHALIDEPIRLQVGTIVQVEAGAAITAGALLESNASGQAITRTTGIPLGKALETSGDANEIIRATFLPDQV